MVRDLRAAVAHYRDVLGFGRERIYGEPPTFGIIARDQMHLMLKQVDDPACIVPRSAIAPGLWDVYFWTDAVDDLFEELRAKGATIDYGLCDQDYGCREFGIRDLDGHDIGFGQVIA